MIETLQEIIGWLLAIICAIVCIKVGTQLLRIQYGDKKHWRKKF